MKTSRCSILIMVAAVLFSSCGTQNKFASSFGKRHYTKGFYVDTRGTIQKPDRNKVILPAEKIPAITTAQVINNPVSERPDIHSVPIAQSGVTASSHRKIIETKAVNTIITQPVSVANYPVITPAADKEAKSVNNIHAIISFLSAVGVIAITSLLAIIFVSNVSLVATLWLIGAIIAIALDALAIYFAIEAYAKKETDTGGSLIILILNGIVLLVALVGYIRNARK